LGEQDVERYERYLTESEVRVIVNDIVSAQFKELYAALNSLRGGMVVLGGIGTFLLVLCAAFEAYRTVQGR
jgi:hypothetical protein